MALANNNENYMPPASTRRMMEDLALLPLWYAQPGSMVLASSAYNADFLEEIKRMFSISVQILTEPELSYYKEDIQIMPWGWNLALCKRLVKGGVLENKIPTDRHLRSLRMLSSREVVNKVLDLFKEEDLCCGASYYLSDLASCEKFVKETDPCVLKAPWSGSGKGLMWCKGDFNRWISGWCENILKEQNGVVGEPVYSKVKDFAMEFYSAGYGRVFFVGYSSFTTNTKGAYVGSLLASSDSIEKDLVNYVPLLKLIRIRETLQKYLAKIHSRYYIGYLGVDMMICRDEEREDYLIHPCVEVNLRMNMGVVARVFHDNFMEHDSIGVFTIKYSPSHEELLDYHSQQKEEFPLIVKNDMFISGYLPLVPVTPKSKYLAYALIK